MNKTVVSRRLQGNEDGQMFENYIPHEMSKNHFWNASSKKIKKGNFYTSTCDLERQNTFTTRIL